MDTIPVYYDTHQKAIPSVFRGWSSQQTSVVLCNSEVISLRGASVDKPLKWPVKCSTWTISDWDGIAGIVKEIIHIQLAQANLLVVSGIWVRRVLFWELNCRHISVNHWQVKIEGFLDDCGWMFWMSLSMGTHAHAILMPQSDIHWMRTAIPLFITMWQRFFSRTSTLNLLYVLRSLPPSLSIYHLLFHIRDRKNRHICMTSAWHFYVYSVYSRIRKSEIKHGHTNTPTERERASFFCSDLLNSFEGHGFWGNIRFQKPTIRYPVICHLWNKTGKLNKHFWFWWANFLKKWRIRRVECAS